MDIVYMQVINYINFKLLIIKIKKQRLLHKLNLKNKYHN
jgi:hypothetical protein